MQALPPKQLNYRFRTDSNSHHKPCGCARPLFYLQPPASSSKKGSTARSTKLVAEPAAAARPREECKMVLCVNTSLGMGKGKIGRLQ